MKNEREHGRDLWLLLWLAISHLNVTTLGRPMSSSLLAAFHIWLSFFHSLRARSSFSPIRTPALLSYTLCCIQFYRNSNVITNAIRDASILRLCALTLSSPVKLFLMSEKSFVHLHTLALSASIRPAYGCGAHCCSSLWNLISFPFHISLHLVLCSFFRHEQQRGEEKYIKTNWKLFSSHPQHTEHRNCKRLVGSSCKRAEKNSKMSKINSFRNCKEETRRDCKRVNERWGWLAVKWVRARRVNNWHRHTPGRA